jgi:hypothetical protein
MVFVEAFDLYNIWMTFQNLSNFELHFGIRKLVLILEWLEYLETLYLVSVAGVGSV